MKIGNGYNVGPLAHKMISCSRVLPKIPPVDSGGCGGWQINTLLPSQTAPESSGPWRNAGSIQGRTTGPRDHRWTQGRVSALLCSQNSHSFLETVGRRSVQCFVASAMVLMSPGLLFITAQIPLGVLHLEAQKPMLCVTLSCHPVSGKFKKM